MRSNMVFIIVLAALNMHDTHVFTPGSDTEAEARQASPIPTPHYATAVRLEMIKVVELSISNTSYQGLYIKAYAKASFFMCIYIMVLTSSSPGYSSNKSVSFVFIGILGVKVSFG